MKCKRCHGDAWPNKSICPKCLSAWSNMRTIVWDYLQNKYGKLSPETLPILQKETRRLDKLWRKDKALFEKEIND